MGGDNHEFKDLDSRALIGTAGKDAADNFIRKAIRIDGITHVITNIDYDHHEIHDGRSFLALKSLQCDTNEWVDMLFKWHPPTQERLPHIQISVSAALAAQADFYVASGRGFNSNVIEPFNRNDFLFAASESQYTSGMSICHTTSSGTEQNARAIGPTFLGAATGSGANQVIVGGQTGSRSEFILYPYRWYRVKVKSLVDGNACTIDLDWYEHKNKTDWGFTWPAEPEGGG